MLVPVPILEYGHTGTMPYNSINTCAIHVLPIIWHTCHVCIAILLTVNDTIDPGNLKAHGGRTRGPGMATPNLPMAACDCENHQEAM